MSNKPLIVGMVGENVAALHQALAAGGLSIPDSETKRRFFGPGTREAVREFQARNGLKQNGKCDEDTNTLLNVPRSDQPTKTGAMPVSDISASRMKRKRSITPAINLERKVQTKEAIDLTDLSHPNNDLNRLNKLREYSRIFGSDEIGDSPDETQYVASTHQDNIYLGLIGNGTDGSDGIERGIHLRAQFLPEMGFPLGGLRFYRRPSKIASQPVCIDFLRIATGERKAPFEVGIQNQQIRIYDIQGKLRVDSRRRLQEPHRSAKPGDFLPFEPLGRPLRTLQVLKIISAKFRFKLPVPSFQVTLHVEFERGGSIKLTGYDDGREVAAIEERFQSIRIKRVMLQATKLEEIRVLGRGISLIKICYRSAESCDDADAWEPISDPLCLPIYYPGKPCKGSSGTDCDEIDIFDRLPKDTCERAKFAASAQDLVSVLRILVDSDTIIPQAERLILADAEPDDCKPPDEPIPEFRMPIIDALLLAALDPALARILGLYVIDNIDGVYDYKVVGNWPIGTLWSLPNCLTFDHMPIDRRILLNWFPAGPLVFEARTRPTVVERPSLNLGTNHALAFFESDDFDWNLPSLPGLIRRNRDEAVVIFFQEPVGEAQIYLGQETPNAALQAFDENGPVSDKIQSSRKEDVLAIHGNSESDKISKVVLSGNRFWLYKICWGPDRISHGFHCAFVYGLQIKTANRPRKPTGMKAYSLSGLTGKEADCEPMLTGETSDDRLSVGVVWDNPENGEQHSSNIPIRYDVIRVDDEGNSTLQTGDQPVIVASPADDADLPPYEPPQGWPSVQPHFIDSGVESGTYRYGAFGISIFGARSESSDLSNAVKPKLPPPAMPTNMSANFLERNDPWLSSDDRTALPEGVNEAIRLRWHWPEGAERMSPDAQGFRVYYSPGMPNVIAGEIEALSKAPNRLVNVTVKLKDLDNVASNLLTGRQLVQNGKRFRIISHSQGTEENDNVRGSMQLRLPPEPSFNRPRGGPFTIPLDASIPIEVQTLGQAGDQIEAKIITAALLEEPLSGLVGSEIQLLNMRARIVSVQNSSYSDNGSEIVVRFHPTVGRTMDEVLDLIEVPLFTKLRLPPPDTAAYRDYSDPSAWPHHFETLIPRTTSGDFNLLMRRAASDELPSLQQIEAGKFILTLENLPVDLDVNCIVLRRHMVFGASCLGPEDVESRVSRPAVLTRVHRGDIGSTAQLTNLDALETEVVPEPDGHIYASRPNFEGKSIHSFAWPLQEGWTYEVYRALDATLYSMDTQIRADTDDDGQPVRSRNSGAYGELLDGLTAGLLATEADIIKDIIKTLVIEPRQLDRDAIEEHPHVDTLLRALSSLPLNDRAFTKLDLDGDHLRVDPTDNNKMLCTDDTLEGRARGRFFYRIRALNAIANISSLGISTPPIYVRGDMRPATPVITGIQGGDREIVIHWAATRDPNIKGYLVYRTDDEFKTDHMRFMELIKLDPNDDFSVAIPDSIPDPLPAEYAYSDNIIQPRVKYFYGVVAVTADDRGNDMFSKISSIKDGQAYDLTPPDPPQWVRAEWVRVDSEGNEFPFVDTVPPGESREPGIILSWNHLETTQTTLVQFSREDEATFENATGWLPPGTNFYVVRELEPFVRYFFRLHVIGSSGTRNHFFQTIQVDPIVTL